MDEEWYSIPNAPKYLITRTGQVKNRSTGKIIKLQQPSATRRYPTVSLEYGGKYSAIGIHLLVARVFVSGQEPGLEVNHIDGDKLNYRPENLEWVTHQENMDHAQRTGLLDGIKRTWVVDGEELVEIFRNSDGHWPTPSEAL